MRLVVIILCIVSYVELLAQKEDYKWTLSGNVLVDFATVPPAVSTNIKNVKFGISCISDKAGQLLFYGDCGNIYDRDHNPIYTLPEPFEPVEKSIIVPQPGSESVFYMFIQVRKNLSQFAIFLVKVKISPLGKAYVLGTDKIQESITQRLDFLMVIKHHNNKDFWLLTEAEKSNQLNSYLIADNVVELKHTSTLNDNIEYTGRYNLKVSPSGQKIVYSSSNQLSVLSFNSYNGNLSSKQSIDIGVRDFCFEFTPSGQEIIIASNLPKRVMKLYDFTKIKNTIAFLNTEKTIATNFPQRITDLQLAPNQRIYANLFRHHSLGVVEKSETALSGYSLNPNALFLKGKKGGWHLPKLLRYRPYFDVTSCQTALFTYHGFTPQSVFWHFGDGNTSTSINPTHIYKTAGKYTVKLTVTYNDNTAETIEKQITIHAKPKTTVIQY